MLAFSGVSPAGVDIFRRAPACRRQRHMAASSVMEAEPLMVRIEMTEKRLKLIYSHTREHELLSMNAIRRRSRWSTLGKKRGFHCVLVDSMHRVAAFTRQVVGLYGQVRDLGMHRRMTRYQIRPAMERQYEGGAPLNACCQPRRPCAACTMLTSICAATRPSAPNPQATTPTPHPHGSSKKGMTSMSLNPSHTNAVKRSKRVRRDSKKTVPGGIRTLDLDIANHKKSIKGWLIRVTR